MRGHLGPRDLCLNIGMQCYIPNFKHLSQVVLKKETFQYFSMYFYGSNLGSMCRGHLGACGLDLNNFGKRPLGNLSVFSYGLNLGPPGAEPSWSLGPSYEQTW